MDALGLYLAIPFCRAKCSFCNFASDAFAPGRMPAYVDRLLAEIGGAHDRAEALGADLPHDVDTIYLGGGTPSLLSPTDVGRIFGALRHNFRISPAAETTVECAPGQLSPATLDELLRHGVNRLSFGVQSLDRRESSAIGRLHTPDEALAEIERVRCAGIPNISVDLIAGLPYQTEISWRATLQTAIATGVPHVSVYMLEVDDDSRLGREVLTGGTRYGAATVPSDDQSADLYGIACDLLESSGIPQYEISNFAQPGFASAHNRKYWERKPYLGLGLDAHSMLRTPSAPVRFANTDDLDAYLAPPSSIRGQQPLPLLQHTPEPHGHRVSREEQLEEALFLGLRLVEGISLDLLTTEFGRMEVDAIRPALSEVIDAGLLTQNAQRVRLTARGRVLSNEVFSRLLIPTAA